MPTSAEPPEHAPGGDAATEAVLLDTSAAMAFVLPRSEAHDAMLARALAEPKGLAGHAAFETYSVLTRLPPPYRLSAAQAAQVIATNFPHGHYLTPRDQERALAMLAQARIAGGAVYDGLVAMAAARGELLLLSCDRRAASTYQALGVRYELIGG